MDKKAKEVVLLLTGVSYWGDGNQNFCCVLGCKESENLVIIVPQKLDEDEPDYYTKTCKNHAENFKTIEWHELTGDRKGGKNAIND